VLDRSARTAAHPRYVGIGGRWFGDRPGTLRLLDTETGLVSRCPDADWQGLDELSCSPWRDGEGRYHLMGRWHDFAADQSGDSPGATGVGRGTFPPSRVVDHVGFEFAVWGRPCWAPDRSDRILFTGGDGRLYLGDFLKLRGPAPSPPQPLRWQVDPPEGATGWHRDPCWSDLPALGGRLLISQLYGLSPTRPGASSHLWWLELSPDGESIVGAEQALVLEGVGLSPSQDEERMPTVGVDHTGRPLLAYLARAQGQVNWELWLMPIEPMTSGRGPRVLTTARRKLAEECAPVLPSFSADGRWIYAGRTPNGTFRLERLAIPADASERSPSGSSSGGPRSDKSLGLLEHGPTGGVIGASAPS